MPSPGPSEDVSVSSAQKINNPADKTLVIPRHSINGPSLNQSCLSIGVSPANLQRDSMRAVLQSMTIALNKSHRQTMHAPALSPEVSETLGNSPPVLSQSDYGANGTPKQRRARIRQTHSILD